MGIINRIEKLLQEKNLTKADLCKISGIKRSTLYNIFDQKTNEDKLQLDTIRNIASALQVSIEFLVNGQDCSHKQSLNNSSSLASDENHLINIYKQLNINSKQIVINIAQMELRHINANSQGDIRFKIIKNDKLPNAQAYLKVYDQPASAGYGSYTDDESFEMLAFSSIPRGAEFGIRISGNSMAPTINDGQIVFVKRQPQIEVGEIGIFIVDGEAFCKELKFDNGSYYLHSLNPKYRDIKLDTDNVYCTGKVIW